MHGMIGKQNGKIDPSSIEGIKTDSDRAYAAGFFDGEGHCRIQHVANQAGGKAYPRLKVSIGQNDRRPLDWLSMQIGGSVSLVTDTQHIWGITGTRAFVFLTQIRPFCKVKDLQIDSVLMKYQGNTP